MTSPHGITFDYDEDADVLYASVGPPRPAISREEAECVLIRRSPKTRELVGFTIIGYGKMKSRGVPIKVPHFENIALP